MNLKNIKHIFDKLSNGDWGLGIGIGDWGLGIGPNPQSPIPILKALKSKKTKNKILKYLYLFKYHK